MPKKYPLPKIEQAQLTYLCQKRAELSALESLIKGIEETILQALKDGTPVESGAITAEIKSFERRNVSWKSKFIDFVDETRGKGEGEKMADRIHSATAPTSYESLNVKVA